jgi:hypothetical protein
MIYCNVRRIVPIGFGNDTGMDKMALGWARFEYCRPVSCPLPRNVGVSGFSGILALGKGLWEHGFVMPAAIGALGIGMMAGALTLPHGGTEILWTILGVGVLALGHDLNHRATN